MIRNNFRILLAKKKKNMADVSLKTGLSKTTIRSLFHENAKGIQFKTIEILCQYFDCKVSDLFEYEKDKESA